MRDAKRLVRAGRRKNKTGSGHRVKNIGGVPFFYINDAIKDTAPDTFRRPNQQTFDFIPVHGALNGAAAAAARRLMKRFGIPAKNVPPYRGGAFTQINGPLRNRGLKKNIVLGRQLFKKGFAAPEKPMLGALRGFADSAVNAGYFISGKGGGF